MAVIHKAHGGVAILSYINQMVASSYGINRRAKQQTAHRFVNKTKSTVATANKRRKSTLAHTKCCTAG